MPFTHPDKIQVLPRFREDLGDLESLARDIKETGQIHPILVEELPEGGLSLLAGHRRLEACRLLNRRVWYTTSQEGEIEIPSDLHRRRIELMENLARKSFSTLEEANLIAEIDRLMKEIYGERTAGGGGVAAKREGDGWSQRDTAQLLGFASNRTISDAIQISKAAEIIPELREAKTTVEAKQRIQRFVQDAARQELVKRGVLHLSSFIDNPQEFFENRIILGDCIECMKELAPGIIDYIVTDPPYRISHNQGKKVSDDAEILGTFDDSQESYSPEELVTQINRITKPNAWVFLFTSIEDFFLYQTLFQAARFSLYPRPLVWAKVQPSPFVLYKGTTIQMESWPIPCYELILQARKGQGSLARQGQPDLLCYPPVKSGTKRHPTEKPVPLLDDLISRVFHPGTRGLLLDPFAGSGSTLVAANRFPGLTSFGYELDPKARERAIAYLIEDYLKQKELEEAAEAMEDL